MTCRPPQTQMPARNDAMPPSLRDLQSQRNIRKLGNTNEGAIGQMGQMGQMGGGKEFIGEEFLKVSFRQ